jgi:hypothetical protein
MDKENTYTTSDLYLASFLKLKGHIMTVEKQKNKAKFIFQKEESIMTDVNDYLTEKGLCEPLLYTNSIKNLKNLLYNL